MMARVIVLNRQGAARSGTASDLQQIAGEYRDHACAHLRGFLATDLLADIWRLCEAARFEERTYEGIGAEQRIVPGPMLAVLLLALNDPQLLAFISEVTGCGPVGVFEGRVYRMLPREDHFHGWHSDASGRRRVAISVNLNRESMVTAPLQVRRRDADVPLAEVANATPGDAVIFRVDDDHLHRIRPTPDAGVRVACAGWFCEGEDIRRRLAT
jgi:hypothetical protein